MRIQFATALVLIAIPAFAQAPDAMKKSDPSSGNSIQCWDAQAAVVRDKNIGTGAQKNDTSAVAGAQQTVPATTGTSTPTRPATVEEAANAKRPPGISDC